MSEVNAGRGKENLTSKVEIINNPHPSILLSYCSRKKLPSRILGIRGGKVRLGGQGGVKLQSAETQGGVKKI
jgi:hypothetical protein